METPGLAVSGELNIGDKVKLATGVIDNLPFWAKGRLSGILTILEVGGDVFGAFTASDKKNGYCGKRCYFIKVS